MGLNFFEPFLNAGKKNNIQKLMFPIILVSILLFSMIGYTVYSLVTVVFLQKSIDVIDAKLNDPAVISKIKEVDEKEKEINKIKQEKDYLKAVDDGINNIDTVTRALLDLLSKQVTTDLYLTDIRVDVNEISVSGLAKTRAEIAQFEYNVRNTKQFDNIYIDRISKSSEVDAQEFGMKMTSKQDLYKLDNGISEQSSGNGGTN